MALITSIPGIGKITAYKLLSTVINIDSFKTAKQFAAYLGISPKQHQSGNYQGKTIMSRLGNARLRKVFYMAALVAKRFNPSLQPMVIRLKEKGKAPKSVIGAVMRKLAHIVFGVLKSKQPFRPSYV
jgi:transposase